MSEHGHKTAGRADALHFAVSQFLYREARLQDQHKYDEWEALWVEDGSIYWVPMSEDADPEKDVSYIYDNRQRLSSRIRQLKTGVRHAQSPQSRLSRVISNVECTETGGRVDVHFTFHLVEARHGGLITWAGRTEEVLVPMGDDFRIKSKKVILVNCSDALSNLAFLI